MLQQVSPCEKVSASEGYLKRNLPSVGSPSGHIWSIEHLATGRFGSVAAPSYRQQATHSGPSESGWNRPAASYAFNARLQLV